MEVLQVNKMCYLMMILFLTFTCFTETGESAPFALAAVGRDSVDHLGKDRLHWNNALVQKHRTLKREVSYEKTIRVLTARLKYCENRATTVSKLQKEVDRLEDELLYNNSYEKTIRVLTARLKYCENRATVAERTESKLQKEDDRLEDELLDDSCNETIRVLTAKSKDAENRATVAERTVTKLQKEVDRLEDKLLVDSYEETIRVLTARSKDDENRAIVAERTVTQLQRKVDKLEDDLLTQKERYGELSDEFDKLANELAEM